LSPLLDGEQAAAQLETGHESPLAPAYGIDSDIGRPDDNSLISFVADEHEENQILMLQGVDPNAVSLMGDTALIVAAIKGNRDSVASLLQAGADANAVNQFGRTGLMEHVSSHAAGVEVVSTLLSGGAEVNAADMTGRTALMESCTFGCGTGIATLLLDAGADVNAKDDRGKTALLEAVSSVGRSLPKIVELTTLLLQRGADANVADDDGQTPLMKALAAASHHFRHRPNESCEALELVTLILDEGANVDAVDSEGRPASAYASHKMVARLLKSRGASPKRWWRT
jgi:uncharacterized protein